MNDELIIQSKLIILDGYLKTEPAVDDNELTTLGQVAENIPVAPLKKLPKSCSYIPLMQRTFKVIKGQSNFTNTISASASVGAGPMSICYANGYIWVTRYATNEIIKINTYDFTKTVISYNTPRGICFDGTHIWVANPDDDEVIKINANTNVIETTYNITATYEPHLLIFIEGYIIVGNNNANFISKINISTGEVNNIATSGTINALYQVGQSSVIVANSTEGQLINIIDDSITTPFANVIPKIVYDGFTYHYYVNVFATTLYLYGQNSYSIGTDGNIEALFFDGNEVWVGTNNNKLQRFKSYTTIRQSGSFETPDILLTSTPGEMCFDGAYMWVTLPLTTSGDIVRVLKG